MKMGRKKYYLLFVIFIFLLSACGSAEDGLESTQREVSSEFRGFFMGYRFEMEERESGMVYEDKPVVFQDEVMEEMLRNMLEKPEGEVYLSELQKIQKLCFNEDNYWSNIQGTGHNAFPLEYDEEGNARWFRSLADLSNCYNLQWLTLYGVGNIPSFLPICELPQLEILNLDCSTMTEERVEEIGKITSLKSLHFMEGKLNSLAALCKLPQLEELSLSGVTVTEEVLSDIGTLPALKIFEVGVYDTYTSQELGADWSDLTDGSFLLPIADQLTGLKAYGGIDWNPDVLSKMTNMEELIIGYAKDISFLEYMPNLKQLSMYCCTPQDWDALALLQKLEYLDITGNMYITIPIKLSDLTPLKKLDYLELIFTEINTECSYQEVVDALPSLTGYAVF